MIINYKNNTGNISSSTGLSDFLLGAALSYHKSLSILNDKYFPYYIKHDTLGEWEYGLGLISYDGFDYVLSRVEIYDSSSGSKVAFSEGTKSVTTAISAERVEHGFNNIESRDNNFYIEDNVQTIYAVTASGGFPVNAYLPIASGNKNLIFGFRLLENSNNNLIIHPSGSDFIDGAGVPKTITSNTKYASLISDGSGWIQLNSRQDLTQVGVPSGIYGSIQYKNSIDDFAGSSDLVWDDANSLLLLGGSESGVADVVIATSGTEKTIFNNQNLDVDFQVKGTGLNNQLYFDAATGRLGINTSNPTTILHLVGRCANENFKLESTSNCPTGVGLTLYHNPLGGSSVGDLPGFINLAGRNSNGQRVNYGKLSAKILGTDINSTSGEIIISVDHNGLDTNIINVSPQKTSVGLGSDTTYNDNISIGNFIVNSGTNSMVFGHNSVLSDGSVNSFILANSGNIIGDNSVLLVSSVPSSGDNNFIAGVDSYSSGNNNLVFGNSNEARGSNDTVLGINNSIDGSNHLINGHNNFIYGNSGVIIGHNVSSVSGLAIGQNINNSGNNLVISNGSSVSGIDNQIFGSDVNATGTNNSVLGTSSSVDGSGNVLFGSEINVTGTNNIVIGKNLSSDKSESVIIGHSSEDIVIDENSLSFNSGLSVTDINIYSNSASSGIFISQNKIGINTKPTGLYTFDVVGSGKIENLLIDTLRLGMSATSGSVLVADSGGYGTWQSVSEISQDITSDLIDKALVTYDGDNLVSTSGLYWDSSSGVLYTDNSNNIIPIGNDTFVVNNNKSASSNIFNIKGSVRNDLFLVETTNDRLGVNVTVPARTVDVSGNFRVSKDSFYYLDKTDNSFIISYDNGVAQNNRFNFTPSGLFIRQTATTPQVLPLLSYGTSYPTTTNVQYTYMLAFDDNLDRVVHIANLTTGFDSFSGASDN